MLGWTPFSYPFNLTQQPACTIPCGLTQSGLPIGLQLSARPFGEGRALVVADAYQRETDWHARVPSIPAKP
jgi:aspartyl-tRNA(Asn)/glutamyl-tRNA(Gln) amidotransferase subunit A